MRPGGGGCPCFRVKSSYDRSATRGEGVLAVSQIIGNLSGSAESVSWFLVFVTPTVLLFILVEITPFREVQPPHLRDPLPPQGQRKATPSLTCAYHPSLVFC